VCDFDAQLFSIKKTQSVWLGWLPQFNEPQLADVASVIRCDETLKCMELQRLFFFHDLP
jgi:hypothetical protein